MSEGDFAISEFALSTQKKFASKLATNAAIRNRLIDNETQALFKVIHQIFKIYRALNNRVFGFRLFRFPLNITPNAFLHFGDKKKAEKLMRDVIKIVVKLGVLQRADRLNKTILASASKKIRNSVMTFISFHEVQFSFDKKLAVDKMSELSKTIHELLSSASVKDKTHARLDNIAGPQSGFEMFIKFTILSFIKGLNFLLTFPNLFLYSATENFYTTFIKPRNTKPNVNCFHRCSTRP